MFLEHNNINSETCPPDCGQSVLYYNLTSHYLDDHVTLQHGCVTSQVTAANTMVNYNELLMWLVTL